MTKILYVPACTFTQKIMAKGSAEKAAWSDDAITPILELAEELNITLKPLPFTESEFLGLDRDPMGMKGYEALDGFTDYATIKAEEFARKIKEDNVIGILGMSYSPACTVKIQYPPKK